MNAPMPALRSIALAMMVACLIGVPIAAFPSVDISKDASNCFGEVLAWHHNSRPCHPRYKYVGSKTPALPVIPALLVVALGAFAMRRWPRPLVAIGWSLAAFSLMVVCAAYTFDFEIFGLGLKTYRWTAIVAGFLHGIVASTAIVTFVAMPIVMIARAIRRRRDRPEPLAPARVVRR